MPTITCPLCRQTIESGPEHCPRCHIRLPGAPARPKAAVRRAARQTPRLASGDPPRRGRSSEPSPASGPPLQCPACAHPITKQDQWCKWCKWPVNRD